MAKTKTVTKNDAGFVVWFTDYTIKSNKDGKSAVIPRFGFQYPGTITDTVLLAASAHHWVEEQNSGLRDLPVETIVARLNGKTITPGARGWDRMSIEELEAQAAQLREMIAARKAQQTN